MRLFFKAVGSILVALGVSAVVRSGGFGLGGGMIAIGVFWVSNEWK